MNTRWEQTPVTQTFHAPHRPDVRRAPYRPEIGGTPFADWGYQRNQPDPARFWHRPGRRADQSRAVMPPVGRTNGSAPAPRTMVHDAPTHREAHRSAAVSQNREITQLRNIGAEIDGLAAAIADVEVRSWFGRQLRWVQAALIGVCVLAAWSVPQLVVVSVMYWWPKLVMFGLS